MLVWKQAAGAIHSDFTKNFEQAEIWWNLASLQICSPVSRLFHVWEVNHLGIRNFPWLCCWIPRGFPQNGTVKSCKNYPFWVLNMTRHCGSLGLKYGQVLWWPTPTWKQSCVEPSSCGSGAMKFIKFTALMPPEIFGKFCKCHFSMAGRHIGDICWYLVAAYCFHDPFRPFCWGLSHWGVEKLERWR